MTTASQRRDLRWGSASYVAPAITDADKAADVYTQTWMFPGGYSRHTLHVLALDAEHAIVLGRMRLRSQGVTDINTLRPIDQHIFESHEMAVQLLTIETDGEHQSRQDVYAGKIDRAWEQR